MKNKALEYSICFFLFCFLTINRIYAEKNSSIKWSEDNILSEPFNQKSFNSANIDNFQGGQVPFSRSLPENFSRDQRLYARPPGGGHALGVPVEGNELMVFALLGAFYLFLKTKKNPNKNHHSSP